MMTRSRLLIVFALLCASCTQEMATRGKWEPFDPGVARAPVEGTVPIEGKIEAMPPQPPLSIELLQRGQRQFNIYCAPCHGQAGDGNGVIVSRGMLPPPSFHIERLKQAPAGHFYQVITDGFGAMYSYASRVEPADRWAVAAYIRALQLSQDVSPPLLSSDDLKKLEER